jgi:putative transcriptional regulator
VGIERGFVLHQEGKWDNTSEIINGLSITTSKDILKSISSGLGPPESLLILGYSGWGPGQLEQELTTSSWINAPANNEILFTVPYENRWRKAINLLGIEATDISDQIGHA